METGEQGERPAQRGHGVSLANHLFNAHVRIGEACPRSFLKRMAGQGMRAEAAVEHEFYLARQENGVYVPTDNSLCYSSVGLDEQAGVQTRSWGC